MDSRGPGASAGLGGGLLLIVLAALVSGVSTFVNAYAVGSTSSDGFVTVRNLVVVGLLVPLGALAARSSPSLRRRDWGRLAIIGLVGGAIPFLLFFHGLQLATQAGAATTASFFYRTLFLMAIVLGVVVLGERMRWRVAAGAALLLGGNLLLLSLQSPILTDGTAYVMAATGLWAVEYTLSKRALRDLPSATVGLGRMGFGAVFLSAYLAATSQWGGVAAYSGAQWTWVGVSAVLLATFVGVWYGGLRRVELGTATSVLLLGFPVTWTLGIVVRGAGLSLTQAVGATAVVAGVAIVVGLSSWRAAGSFLAGALGLRPAPST